MPPTTTTLLLSLLPDDLLADLFCAWIDPETDVRAVAEAVSLAAFARLAARPGFAIRATKVLSEASTRWLVAHAVQVRWLETAVVDVRGNRAWYQNGRLHRDGDLPAVVRTDGCQVWFQHGQVHRDGDLPAWVWGESRRWFRHGQVHRDGDLPASVEEGKVAGTYAIQVWYQFGRRHRMGDLPAYVGVHGQEWYRDGHRHRDGHRPAVVMSDGSRQWWKFGRFVREGRV